MSKQRPTAIKTDIILLNLGTTTGLKHSKKKLMLTLSHFFQNHIVEIASETTVHAHYFCQKFLLQQLDWINGP